MNRTGNNEKSHMIPVPFIFSLHSMDETRAQKTAHFLTWLEKE